MAMNVIELTEVPVVETVPEGATCFCLNPDGSVNRFALDNLNRVEEVIFTVTLPTQVVETASSSEDNPSYTCTCNKTPKQLKALIKSGEKVEYICDVIDENNVDWKARMAFIATWIAAPVSNNKKMVVQDTSFFKGVILHSLSEALLITADDDGFLVSVAGK